MKHLLTILPFAFACLSASAQQHPYTDYSSGSPDGFGNTHSTAVFLHQMDADQDGDLDMVRGTKIIVNKGEGIYGPEFYPFGPASWGLNDHYISHDHNNDGYDDILLAGDWVYVLGGEVTEVAVGQPWLEANLVDLDLDGDLDIVALEDDRVVQYMDQGDGTYTEAIVIKEINNGFEIHCDDLNMDGYPDLIASWSDHLWWWANNGSGGYGGGNNIENTPDDTELCIGDVDADGYNDIIQGTTYRRNLIGSYDAPQSMPGNTLNNYQRIDIDGDGDLDFFGTGGGEVRWHETLEVGMAPGATLCASSGSTTADFRDVDNDGIPEILANGGGIRFWRQTGALDFVSDPFFYGGGSSSTGGFIAADVNEDGADELLTSGASISWRGNTGVPMPVHVGGDFAELGVSDVNDDGHLDVVFAGGDGTFGWVPNSGQGIFDPAVMSEPMADALRMLMADVDHDGDLDAAILNDAGILWMEDTGSGFTASHTVWDYPLLTKEFAVLDVNGDGDLDFVTESEDFPDLVLIESDGAGGYLPPQSILDTPQQVRAIVNTDFNADGFEDLLFVTYSGNFGVDPSGFLGCLWGSDTGLSGADTLSFMPPGSAIDFGPAANLYAGDLNADGIPDLTIHTSQAGRIDYVENDGVGGVASHSPMLWNTSIFNSWDDGGIGDLDGDGLQDVFTRVAASLHWIKNTYGLGCTDPEACNYHPYYFMDDGSCCYGVCGCMIPQATNYNPEAECDDFSCAYSFTGIVFDDQNVSGTYDEGEDTPLPFTQVLITPGDILLYTDDYGQFSVELPPDQYFTFQTQNHPVFPFTTTTNPRTINTSSTYWQSTPIPFGLNKDQPLFEVCVDFYPGSGGLCDAPRNFNICYRNGGNVPIDGIIEVEYDPLFQGYNEVTPIDSVVGNKLYMSFEDLPPGNMYFYDVELIMPTTDFIGDTLFSTTRIYGFYEGEQVAFGEQGRVDIVTCAYDPNDKQAFPLGETEDHLLREDQTQEFVVRFQNTGNAPAQNIIIRDTLDVNFDLNSFEFVANSHSVQTTLNPETRELTFFFPEIMLPDSNCCEPESHGLVSYKIRPLPGLPAGTRLENTAYIFFDNNPPIVTNTTWTTLHECRDWLNLEASTDADCLGDQLLITSDYDNSIAWPQTYLWTNEAGTTTYGTELILDYEVDNPIDEVLSLSVSNPLCTEQGWVSIDFVPLNLPGSCTGDLNCDAIVGTDDLILFLGEYGCIGESCMFDLDGDGAVLAEDLLTVLGVFGTTCE